MLKVIRQMAQLTLRTPLLASPPGATSFDKLLAVPSSPAITQSGYSCSVHTSSLGGQCAKWSKNNYGPRRWLEYNKTMHRPQDAGGEPRKANLCHMRSNIKYSPDKMWYIAAFVRGMSVDEALKQLNFVLKKGATDVRETILEAQLIAVEQHNVEYKSNVWIAESFVTKGRVFNGMRRHARGRFGRVEYKHCNYFLRLEEGEPPQRYYLPEPQRPQQQYDSWLEHMSSRKVINSL